jgi:hypothetical protein
MIAKAAADMTVLFIFAILKVKAAHTQTHFTSVSKAAP